MLKVWYINNKGEEVIEGNFNTYEEGWAYASKLEAEGKIHERCLQAEGARVFMAR